LLQTALRAAPSATKIQYGYLLHMAMAAKIIFLRSNPVIVNLEYLGQNPRFTSYDAKDVCDDNIFDFAAAAALRQVVQPL